MGYSIYSMRGGYGQRSETMEFEEAAMMAKEGVRKMCELAEEMREQYGERRRGSYGSREDWDGMDDMYGERRRRDSRGRYM